MPRSNVAAVLHDVGDVRVESVPEPQPGPRDVVIEVQAVGVCGSDVHYYEHGKIGDFVVEQPLVLGHEASGTVVATGAHATRHDVGQRVAIEPGVPCSRCAECRIGRYNLCRDIRFFATPPIDGAFARYVAVHEDFAFPIPDGLSDEAGAMIEPLSVGIWANRKAGTTVGSRVLVTGCGPIGCVAAQVAKAHGAAAVMAVDVNPDRLKQMEQFGITAIDGRTNPDLAATEPDVLLECTGVETVVRDGISALRPAGTAVLVGMGATSEQRLPIAHMQARELILTGTFRYANTYPTAIELASSGRVELDGLVGARFSLDETEDALRIGHTNPAVLKAVVQPATA